MTDTTDIWFAPQDMKKIGLVGGTGSEFTLMYYKELNSRIDALTNGSAMPDLAIKNVTL